MMKSFFLVLTSAIAIEGNICRAGALIEVSEREAKNLLARGKARLATVDDGAPEHDEESEQDDLSKLNKAALLELAKSEEIEGADSMTKAELIEALQG